MKRPTGRFTGLLMLLGIALIPMTSPAEQKVDSIYPSLGTLGQSLEITVNGSGFDGNTRLSMFPSGSLIVSSLHLTGLIHSIDVAGNLAYLATGEGGLQIADLSDKMNPRLLAWSSVESGIWSGDVWDVLVRENMAYMACNGGVYLIDMTNPSDPQLLSWSVIPAPATDIASSGDRVYAIGGNPFNSLCIIDVRDPDAPELMSRVDLPDAQGISVENGVAFVACGEGGVRIVDVTDPWNPGVITSIETPGQAYEVAVEGELLFVADGGSGMRIIDITNIDSPQNLGVLNTPGTAFHVEVIGKKAFIAAGESGLLIIDISRPKSPFITVSIDTEGSARRVNIVDGIAYVADTEGVLGLIDLDQHIGTLDTTGYSTDVSLSASGETAYVTEGDGGLKIVDIRVPERPLMLGSVDTPGWANEAIVSDSLAYVADGEAGLQIIDVSDPAIPRIIGSEDTPFNALHLAVSGDTAYIADELGGLRIINVTDPSAPASISELDAVSALDVAVEGTTAFVIDESSGLHGVDVSDPFNPVIIYSENSFVWRIASSLHLSQGRLLEVYRTWADTHFRVFDITEPASPNILGGIDFEAPWYYGGGIDLVDNFVFISGATEGFSMVDITDPAHPVVMGWVDTLGTVSGVAVRNQFAYIAGGSDGLVISPVPVELEPITVNNPINLSVSLPSPAYPGTYGLYLFNGFGAHWSYPGAITFVDNGSTPLSAKAVILAGRGPTDELWTETNLVAEHAYEMLRVQGYTNARIKYLSSDTGSPYVDGLATLSNFSDAIGNWSLNASSLLVYLVGHGGEEVFNINPVDTITASTLKGWLDELQNTMTGPVIFIYDACYSGTFLPVLAEPGTQRILVSSGSDGSSWLIHYGYTSFSFQFWSAVSTDANLNDAFNAADFAMSPFQNALLDANGNGRPGEPEDRTIAASISIGRGRVVEPDPSPIISVSPPSTLYGPITAPVWAEISSSKSLMEKVWAIVISPDDGEQTSIIEIDLTDTDADGRYECTFGGFSVEGTYIVDIYAKDFENNVFHARTILTQRDGTNMAVPDAYEDDDTSVRAGTVLVGDQTLRQHSFHDVGDADWIMFYAIAGQTYQVQGDNPSPVCDLVIQLYGPDGMAMLKESDSRSAGGEETLYWTCPADGIYFVRLFNRDANVFGETVDYELEVLQPNLSDAGMITGYIMDVFGNPVPGARVKTDGNGGNLSREDGSYLIRHQPGSFTMSAEADGYERMTHSIIVETAAIHTMDIVLMSCADAAPGDVNNDNLVDLMDAILGLQVVTGVAGGQTVCCEADVDGDNRIGLGEVLFVLQRAGG